GRHEGGRDHAARELAHVEGGATALRRGRGGVSPVGSVAVVIGGVVGLVVAHPRVGTRVGLLPHASGLVVLSGIPLYRLRLGVVPTEGSPSRSTTRPARSSEDDRADPAGARGGGPAEETSVSDGLLHTDTGEGTDLHLHPLLRELVLLPDERADD